MLAKEMLLKKIRLLKFIVFFLPILLFKQTLGSEIKKQEIIQYLENLKFFSSSFIQQNDLSIEEGQLFIGEKRIRVEYSSPSKILIILDENKAMYYNYDLDEDEFFNPKDTSAWFFFEIFKNPNFFLKSKIQTKEKNTLIINKGSFDDENYELIISFEEDPMILRKIKLKIGDTEILLSIFNHKFEEEFENNFFKLINPKILN